MTRRKPSARAAAVAVGAFVLAWFGLTLATGGSAVAVVREDCPSTTVLPCDPGSTSLETTADTAPTTEATTATTAKSTTTTAKATTTTKAPATTTGGTEPATTTTASPLIVPGPTTPSGEVITTTTTIATESSDTDSDNTGKFVAVAVGGLVLVAILTGALTVWYWRRTKPRDVVEPDVRLRPPRDRPLEAPQHARTRQRVVVKNR